jgi:hypothetical protein
MLAVDIFCGCLSDRIRNRLRNDNTDLITIPSVMTSQLQPLNVSVNIPFKHLVCKHCVAWLNTSNYTGCGKLASFFHIALSSKKEVSLLHLVY